ncbi:MAG TPA: alpha/beta hydrolase family protein [Bryobacteraceae bacterium]|nr:alpha/beta hydrolase family protein [Bryobacteraceae bacterium]
MKSLLRPVAHQYRSWMDRWENELCFRANDRVVRPFEYGFEWCEHWPCAEKIDRNRGDPVQYLVRLNEYCIANSVEFFGYNVPQDFNLVDEWLQFSSPVQTPYAENNKVRARWFPARNQTRKAVVVLPHWNSTLPQHNALCAGLQRLGISALRLSLPYHDSRMPAELTRADYAVSSNVCRTIDATRQSVIDSRCCFDWLQQQGFEDLGIVGTSLGSCYAFLASAHDPRIRVNVFNHCSTYFADVVWEGLSTRHIRDSLQTAIDLETLRKVWLCISPPSYWNLYAGRKKQSKFIYTRYDTTFPVHLSRQVIEGAKAHHWRHEVTVLPCGHYTMGEFPFKFITGYEICSYLKRNL